MKKSPSGSNTLIFIWLKGFIQIFFPVILHNTTVPCLFHEISSGVTSWSSSDPPPQKYLCGLILVMALKYMKMFKYAGNAAKLYSKVSSVSQTENLKPEVNINQKWFMNVKVPTENRGMLSMQKFLPQMKTFRYSFVQELKLIFLFRWL